MAVSMRTTQECRAPPVPGQQIGTLWHILYPQLLLTPEHTLDIGA